MGADDVSLTSIAIISPEAANGRNVVAIGVTQALTNVSKTAVFRPASCKNGLTPILLSIANSGQDEGNVRGTCACRARRDKDTARADIVAIYDSIISDVQPQSMVIVGTDKSNIFDPDSFAFNAQIAADLAAPVFLAICTINRSPKELMQTVQACIKTVENEGTTVQGVFITGCTIEQTETLKPVLQKINKPTWTIPAVDFSQEDAVENAKKTFAQYAPAQQVLDAIQQPFSAPTTPFAFQHSLLGKAKANKKTIVLPEGNEPRILQAADFLLERDIVDIILIGEKEEIDTLAAQNNLTNINKAQIQSIHDEQLLPQLVEKLCELRANKNLTSEQAYELLKDPSYFGTMLIATQKADGLVSGSVNSTANTVRPALQVIKTKPEASLVSGSFIMCFKDHVAIFADCAINLNPTAQQLAQIAVQTAHTAKAFGLEPKIGMLSYSTLGSGKGPDVDLVSEATALVQELAPQYPVVGPIQFDAAWSPTVAQAKASGNDVAGHVNVFVFPNLNAGNIAYKAVQRSANALAVGPILQGLRKPVNDLSRGALVQDIINTIALTAIES
ncbi:MAG: phosphate acetyltransferase [Bifidobacteriaceae bacterium]|nr:phosphate acetyltransferase [Bifidobacteriaceae bacterium]